MSNWYQGLPQSIYVDDDVNDWIRVYSILNDVDLYSISFNGDVKNPKAIQEKLNSIGLFKRINYHSSSERDEYGDSFAEIYMGKNGCAILNRSTISNGHYLQLNNLNDPIKEEVIADLRSLFSKGSDLSNISFLVIENGNLRFRKIGNVGKVLIRENYDEDILKGYDRICDTLATSRSDGSIVVMEGPTGTGKSFLIRALIHDIKAHFVFVSSRDVEGLTSPGALPTLIREAKNNKDNPFIFIIEDGDEIIMSRKESTNSLISSVLNMGDGILGDVLNCNIIVSTNLERAKIDDAILRPGRLNTYITTAPLNRPHAEQVYKRLCGRDLIEKGASFTLADIYSKASETGYEFKRKERQTNGRYA